ncbi:hypothetical protein PGTUg99_027169 [Puccinia graminis f. sp. tritici]|uniref:Uncharacterized protein n=1 Tax=Puccinia graminis f. sp. tritici TaxID=56615 RepID=A0A5B0PQ20_PUCGR|nr:hypothetical protein PGTUg99_027169 [Puccinia graminis f. sp. tritici]
MTFSFLSAKLIQPLLPFVSDSPAASCLSLALERSLAFGTIRPSLVLANPWPFAFDFAPPSSHRFSQFYPCSSFRLLVGALL